ncbi:MAG TPA: response regulator [Steroidobacteraceae bacterium]|nr:response regulator [Steroidobacteraceae bacterium]
MSLESRTVLPTVSEKVNILLVDDQPARLLSYETILSGLGHNLVLAHSGLEALEKLMQHDFAVILLDVSMPGMDGFETAALIHQHPRFEKTPIIFVTGVHVTELDRLRGYKLGAVDYVYIPVVPEILRSKVGVLVELHQRGRELRMLNQALERANDELTRANASLQAEKNRELEELNRVLRQANLELETANRALQIEISERARVEQVLKEADRHKNEFLAMLAHELRNPLAPIRNAVEIMQREDLSDAQRVWTREIIERQVGHLTRLVDDLLDVSRITRGKINVSREPMTVGDFIARAAETVQPHLTDKHQELLLDLPEEAVRVEGDLTRLTQAVANVLSNAVKYTDEGGRIQVNVRAQGSWAEIRVRDNGIGIPADQLPKVFDLFTQVERASERAPGGLGIGLALVRKLVEMHGGSVTAHSAGAGEGSEFVIRLPRLVEQTQQMLSTQTLPTGMLPTEFSAAANAGSVSVPGRRILIVDDNRDALESLATLMQMAGHQVETAADGELAWQAAADCRPEVMLLDLGLPKLDGYEVARRIRAQEWGKSVVLVALTGWGQDEDRRRTREAGFDSHMVKPLNVDLLTEFLNRLPDGSPSLTHS